MTPNLLPKDLREFAPQSPAWRWSLLVIVILCLVIYGQTINHGFLNLDDNEYVTDNHAIQQGLNLRSLEWAAVAFHSHNWHPVTWVMHTVNYTVFKDSAGGHHLVNVAFHIINTLLLITVFGRLTGLYRPARIAGLLFALHPLHVESVAWIAELKDLLSAFFLLLVLFAYDHSIWLAARQRRGATAWYSLSVGLFALGLMSKPMLVTVPLLLLVIDIGILKRRQSCGMQRLLVEKLPFVVLAAASSVMTLYVQSVTGAVHTHDYTLPARLTNAVNSCAIYLVNMVWPHPLAIYYPFPQQIDWIAFCGSVLLIGVISWLVFRRRQSDPLLAAGWLWYLITLLPVLGIIQVGAQARADRYTYLPLIGIFLMIGYLAERHLRHRIAPVCYAGGWVLISAALTLLAFQQTSHWKSSSSIFEHSLRYTAGSALVYNNLGLAYLRSHKQKEGIQYLEMALQLDPRNSGALNNLGLLASLRGDRAAARDYYVRAVQADPSNPRILINLANLSSADQNPAAALDYLQRALLLNPNEIQLYRTIAEQLELLNRPEDAATYLRRAIRLAPAAPKLYNDLGLIYVRQNRLAEALSLFEQALTHDPGFVPAQRNLQTLRNRASAPAPAGP